MITFAELIEDKIIEIIDKTLETKNTPNDIEYIETDNLGEIIEKLVILHIRTWMLEDAIQTAESDWEVADIKRKLDICFKVKRPKLVQAVNKLVDNAITTNKSLREDSVKLYKNVAG